MSAKRAQTDDICTLKPPICCPTVGGTSISLDRPYLFPHCSDTSFPLLNTT